MLLFWSTGAGLPGGRANRSANHSDQGAPSCLVRPSLVQENRGHLPSRGEVRFSETTKWQRMTLRLAHGAYQLIAREVDQHAGQVECGGGIYGPLVRSWNGRSTRTMRPTRMRAARCSDEVLQTGRLARGL
jgi:hypothetical protein